MNAVPAPATSGKVIAGDGTVCSCGDDDLSHRYAPGGGRGACRRCPCDGYLPAADDVPAASVPLAGGIIDRLDPLCTCGAPRSAHRTVGGSRDGRTLLRCNATGCADYTPADLPVTAAVPDPATNEPDDPGDVVHPESPARPEERALTGDEDPPPGGAPTLIASWRSWLCRVGCGSRYTVEQPCCGKPCEPVRVEIHREDR